MNPSTTFLTLLFAVQSAMASSYCYLSRSDCFVVDDKKADIHIYSKRNRFIDAAKRHGIATSEIEAMIKKAEGQDVASNRKDDPSIDISGGIYYDPYDPWYDHHHHHHDHDSPSHHAPVRPSPPSVAPIMPSGGHAAPRPSVGAHRLR